MTMRWNSRSPEQEASPSPPARERMYVDAGAKLSGTLRVLRDVWIEGSVDGEIECAGTVNVGPGGRVTAHVRASCVVIEGEVRGDIEAASEITLRKTARVHGDLTTEGIVIQRGAKLEGRITIGTVAANASAAAKSAPVRPEAAQPVSRSGAPALRAPAPSGPPPPSAPSG